MTASSPFEPHPLSARLRQELVAALIASGALHAPALEHAFLTIPREAFVPFFLEEDETRTGMAWIPINGQERSPEVYLAKVYRDQPLVTKIDERGMPISSSSMPSVMAKMLEALDVQPGQRVLEIGTGTGYNAALLATLTGNPSTVVSIEYDAALAMRATEAIERVLGPGLQVMVGDGYAGYPQRAPFDRILATASVPTVPMAWVQQLRMGGKLVMDLQGSLTSGFLVLERTAEGAEGHFLAEPLYFMPLTTPKISVAQLSTGAHLSEEQRVASFVLESGHAFPEILFDVSFRWFLQWRIAGCQMKRRKQFLRGPESAINSILVIDPSTMATVRFQQQTGQTTWSGEVYGLPHFWDDLQRVSAEFLALGKPQPHHYRLAIEEETASLFIGEFKLPLLCTEKSSCNRERTEQRY